MCKGLLFLTILELLLQLGCRKPDRQLQVLHPRLLVMQPVDLLEVFRE
jgi:hypothetical protein